MTEFADRSDPADAGDTDEHDEWLRENVPPHHV